MTVRAEFSQWANQGGEIVPTRIAWIRNQLTDLPGSWHFADWDNGENEVRAIWGYEELVLRDGYFDQLSGWKTRGIRLGRNEMIHWPQYVSFEERAIPDRIGCNPGWIEPDMITMVMAPGRTTVRLSHFITGRNLTTIKGPADTQ